METINEEEHSVLESTKMQQDKAPQNNAVKRNSRKNSNIRKNILDYELGAVSDEDGNVNPLNTESNDEDNAHLKETDQKEVMQTQKVDSQKNTHLMPNKPSNKQSDDEDAVPRSVTVVEHEQGFKPKVINIRHSEPSSASSNHDLEPMLSSSDKGSFKGISEMSKPLSPMTSQRLSPKDQPFNYIPQGGVSPNDTNSKNKNNVKFKEEEFGEEEGELEPAKEPLPASNHIRISNDTNSATGLKNSSTKITSILKNSQKDKNSVVNQEENSENLNKNFHSSLESDSDGNLRQSKDTAKKKGKIPNMKVEEDQVNLSDLGNGPEKPTIKKIYKKVRKAKGPHNDEEPEPSSVISKNILSPESQKSKASSKASKVSKASKASKAVKLRKKSEEEAESEGEYESDENSEDSEDLDDSEYIDYKMKSDLFNFQKLTKHANFKVKRYKDAIYRGCIDPKSENREGLGVMEYDNGRVYEGHWKDDLRTGAGYEIYANGNFYRGEFLNGKAHGKGYYKWANGEYYDGHWDQGQKEGYGEWLSHDGETYIGHWKEGKASGTGCYTWKNGDKYDGEWLQCLKHGKGQDLFANGDSYTGQYRYGKPWGIGVYQWKNGSMYKGQFKNGLKHGKGKWSKGKGEEMCTFEGNYVKGKKEGYGEFRWASGNFYRGEYKDDERHGYGEMYWVDESCYKGSWVNGIQHGKGVMTMPDGTVKKGMFENNTFIEEITEEDEHLESSMYDNEPITAMHPAGLDESKVYKKRKLKKKKKGKKHLTLPHLDTHGGYGDQSGRQYTSAKKPMIKNLSESSLKKNGKFLNLNSAHSPENPPRLRKTKNTLSLPRIDSRQNDSALSERLQGFTGIAKTQAAERKKLQSYFKSLDKAVQILRQKRQNELANRPWVPAGPIHNYQYRPASKYG